MRMRTSPLTTLVNITLGVLANMINTIKGKEGIVTEKIEIKLSLFMGDMII